MYKKGDVLLYKLDSRGIKKGERFYIKDVTISSGGGVYYHVSDKGSYTYTFTDENIHDKFITLEEHRKLIIKEIID